MKDFLGFAITNARAEFKITHVEDSNTWGTERDASASPPWEPLSETCVWDPSISPLRVVCAWCKKLLQEGAPNAATSHSICPDCLVTLNAEDRTCER